MTGPWRRGAIWAAGLGALVALGLGASLPAGVAARWAGLPLDPAALGGTVWHGGATLAGGHVLVWDWDWGASLSAGGARWALRLDGPDTGLSGRLALAPGAVWIEGLAGRAGWRAVAAWGAAGGAVCDPVARVALDRVDLHPAAARGAAGRLDIPAGVCRIPGRAAPVPVPPLRVLATRGPARLVVTGSEGGATLAEVTLDQSGLLRADLTAEGAALVPGLTGPVSLETRL